MKVAIYDHRLPWLTLEFNHGFDDAVAVAGNQVKRGFGLGERKTVSDQVVDVRLMLTDEVESRLYAIALPADVDERDFLPMHRVRGCQRSSRSHRAPMKPAVKL